MDLNKIDWYKAVGRKADLQKAIQFSCNGARGFGRFFEINDLASQLYYFDGRTTSIYFSEREAADFIKRAHDKLEDIEFVKRAEREILEVCNRSLSQAEGLLQQCSPTLSPPEILTIFKKFDDIWNAFYPAAWAFFFIVGFESRIEKNLLKSGFNQKEAETLIKIAANPGKLTPVMEAEVEILKLTQIRDTDTLKKKALELSQKFGWMSVYNTEDKERDPDYYLASAKKVIESGVDIKRQLEMVNNNLEENESLFESHLNKIQDPLLIEQLKFLHLSGYLRDKREEARDRLTIMERAVYQLIGEKLDIDLNDVVFLTNNEIESALLSGNNLGLRNLAARRKQQYAFIIDNGKFEMIDDQDKILLITKLFETEAGVKEVKGQVAYRQKDKVKGIVRVVLSNKELEKVKDGDILVATMTKPDFLVSMKKAAAFVTDEGGITCHAAIVAREMKKPCIIGTKNATRVLKDGDLVEVDADKGVVRIIK